MHSRMQTGWWSFIALALLACASVADADDANSPASPAAPPAPVADDAAKLPGPAAQPQISTDDNAINPGEEAQKAANEGKEENAGVEGSGGSHVPTYRLPRIVVEGQKAPALKEDELVGPYKQPRWTAHRRFPSTRIYVRPEGEIELEWWSRTKVKRGSAGVRPFTQQINQFEVEFGLPCRFQLDLYLVTEQENSGEMKVDQSFELRWAIADWGVIPLNPTLYFEYKLSGVMEVKLLLGDTLADGLHFGTNFVWEQSVYGTHETVLEWTAGISYSAVDSVFSLGIELKFEIANEQGSRDSWEENLRIGPTFQLHPLEAMHIDFAPLFGITENSRLLDMYIVVGWEF
ncbi:MAG: hypothetical protein AB7K09_04375 [Planctomycetota bacterium]